MLRPILDGTQPLILASQLLIYMRLHEYNNGFWSRSKVETFRLSPPLTGPFPGGRLPSSLFGLKHFHSLLRVSPGVWQEYAQVQGLYTSVALHSARLV